MLVAFISPVKFSNIIFLLLNFVRSLKFYSAVLLQNNFGESLKSLEIRLFYRKLNSRKRGNSLSVFHRNSPKHSNDQRETLLKLTQILRREKHRIPRHYSATATNNQANKLSQLQNTDLNLLTVTFLAILKWTAINLRWLVVDGSVKQAKDWRLPLTFRSKIYVQRWAGKKVRPVGRIVKSWTGHVRVISQSNSRT